MPTTENPGYDDLPLTLFPVRIDPWWANNQEEFERLAAVPPEPRPIPASEPKDRRAFLKKRLPYRRLTPDEWRRQLMMRTEEIDVSNDMAQSITPPIGEGVPPAPVVAGKLPEVLGGAKRTKHIATRAACSQIEWNLYVETWNAWFTDYPEYALKQADMDDVATICWETVVQCRIQSLEAARPRDFTAAHRNQYHSSHIRMQEAKKSLEERRKPGKGGAGGNVTLNVAVMAGEVDATKLEERRKLVANDKLKVVQFLTDTSGRQNPFATPDQASTQADRK